jgi:hypothetical protein
MRTATPTDKPEFVIICCLPTPRRGDVFVADVIVGIEPSNALLLHAADLL